MATHKPQFNCYLDPQVEQEIADHLKQTGLPKGKLVEQMWRFYNLRDLGQLHTKLAAFVVQSFDPNQAVWLARISALLKKVLQGAAE